MYVGGVVVVFGKWGLGKSSAVLDLALAISHDCDDWHGQRLWLHGKCAILGLEGVYVLPIRLEAS